MTIKRTETGALVVTDDAIKVFRALSLRGSLSLEAAGLKRRGQSALAAVRALTGLKARTAAEMEPKYRKWLEDNGYTPKKETNHE